jgi:hypothetical protein
MNVGRPDRRAIREWRRGHGIRAPEYIPGPAARHNGGTQNVRPIVHDLDDQNILSGHDSAL